MRLIDADKLMLSLNDNYLANCPTGNETLAVQDYRESLCEGLEIAMATVEGTPTVGGWISVKDRLPPMYHMVLITGKNSAGGSFGVIKGSRDGDKGNWYRDDIGQYVNSRGDTVTHWMPLPEPPKEEKPECD